jgi:glycosyltransferase involved in cell wall biosynthesis
LKMKILFLTKYSRLGASSRYRSFQFIPYLEGIGIACEVSPLFSDEYLRYKYIHGKASIKETARCFLRRVKQALSARSYDLVVIEKEIFPYVPLFIENCLYRSKVPFVLDYDDAIFHKYDMSDSKVIRYLLGDKIKDRMRTAVRVTTGSPYLTEYALKAGARVSEIPTVIDLHKYPTRKAQEPDVFTIGWIGSPTTSQYVVSIVPALERFSSKHECAVKLIGYDRRLLNRLKNLPAEVIDWDEITEVGNLQAFTVGIMPLPDTSWTRGKCGFKLIQYMGCFLPVIASPVGVNSRIVSHGSNGFLAADMEQWFISLEKLYADIDTRAEMGHNGRRMVESAYSLQVTAPAYAEVLKDGPGKRPAADTRSVTA